jgi:hypothetical protein
MIAANTRGNKILKPRKSRFINNLFVITLIGSVGGVLSSVAAAEPSMPVASWASLYVGLAGFTALLVIIITAVGGEVSRFVRNRLAAQPEKYAGTRFIAVGGLSPVKAGRWLLDSRHDNGIILGLYALREIQ